MTENRVIDTLKNFPLWNVDDRWLTDEGMDELVQICIKSIKENREYRSIGTVEECRAAVEKQRAKKPLSRTHCKDGNHPLSQDIGRCPSCNGIVAEDMLWCDDCGQKLDWGDFP